MTAVDPKRSFVSNLEFVIPGMVKKRSKRFWAGMVLAPLPMVTFLVAASALVSGISMISIAYVLIGCLIVWVPMFASLAVLRLTSWSSLRARLGLMFALTFIPMLSVYKFYEFDPDASFSYEINNGGTHLIEFSVAGVVIALIVGLINVLCMWIAWSVDVRPRTDPASDS